jgi:Tfp pilus assembly protein PilN
MIPGLNLLPPDQKRLVSEVHVVTHWRGGLLLIAIFSLMMVGGLVWTNADMQNRAQQLDEQLHHQQSVLQKSGTTDITAATVRLNIEIGLLSQALVSNRKWSDTAQDLISLATDKVRITKVVINARRQVTIEGVAETRVSFISFGTALQQAKSLSNVTTTSTASLRENLPFIYHAVLAN